jgi:hypothetical protein
LVYFFHRTPSFRTRNTCMAGTKIRKLPFREKCEQHC